MRKLYYEMEEKDAEPTRSVKRSEDNSIEDKVKIQPRRNSPLSIHGFCQKEAHRSEILNLKILSCGMNS